MKNYEQKEINPGEAGYYAFVGNDKETEEYCPAHASEQCWAWACTREPNHPAPHAAHTSDGQQQATWED